MQYSAVQYSTIQYGIGQYSTVQYRAVKYNREQYSTVHTHTHTHAHAHTHAHTHTHSTGGAQTADSDPADFVWGARGLDGMISSLLESISDRGPPPAKKENVEAIPVIDATQEIVNKCETELFY